MHHSLIFMSEPFLQITSKISYLFLLLICFLLKHGNPKTKRHKAHVAGNLFLYTSMQAGFTFYSLLLMLSHCFYLISTNDSLHILFMRHVESAWNEFCHSQWIDKNCAAFHRDSRVSKGGKK